MALSLTALPHVTRLSPLDRRELEAVIKAMLDRAQASPALVELALLDDAAMRALHKQALGCDGPTNILSFPAPDERPDEAPDETSAEKPDESPEEALGSLALSVDTLRREAFLYGQDPAEHQIRLLAHGLAHLFGHDHGPAMDALAEALEEAGRAILD